LSKKLLQALTLVLALALFAAGCGGTEGAGDDETTAAEGGDADEASDTASETTDASEDEGTAGGDAPEALTIAVQGPLTGDNAALGINVLCGVQLAVDEANEAGELGIELSVEGLDTQGSPDQAPAVAQGAASNEAIVAMVGPVFSGESAAAGPIYEEAGLPFVTPSATNPDLSANGWTNFFRTVATDAAQGPVAAQFIAENLGATSVAVIDDSGEYGRGLADIVASSLEEAGVEVVFRQGVEAGQQDYSAIVGQVAQSGAEAVFFGGYYSEAGLIRRQLSDAGATDLTFVSDDGAFDPGFIEGAGADVAEGSFATFPGADPSSVEQEFLDAYAGVEGCDAPGAYSIEGYQNTQLIIQAMQEGNTDRDSIREYLAGFSGEVFGKEIEFGDNGDISAQSFFVYEVVDGEWVQQEQIEAEV